MTNDRLEYLAERLWMEFDKSPMMLWINTSEDTKNRFRDYVRHIDRTERNS